LKCPFPPKPFGDDVKAVALAQAKDPSNLIFYLGNKTRQMHVMIPGLHPTSRSVDFLNLMLV